MKVFLIIFFAVLAINSDFRESGQIMPASVVQQNDRITGTLIDAKEYSMELYGVTVTPHFISGEIPTPERDESFSSTYNPGALVKFFVRNRSKTDTLYPVVRFNGKTGSELLKDAVISYGNTPDIRINSTPLTSFIPPESIDFYLLNITDSNFYSKGIRITVEDSLTGKRVSRDINIIKPDFRASRIIFTSSDGSPFPDGFNIWFENASDKEITVNHITVWRSGQSFRDHWWNESIEPEKTQWFGKKGSVPARDMNGAFVSTGKLPFGELIIETDIRRNGVSSKIFYNIKPMILKYDLGMGWADKYLAGSEAFCKTMGLLHLNTVNGNASSFFDRKEFAEKYEIKKFAKLPDVDVQNNPENLKRIHGAEHFGEPQFDRKPAQDIYNYYTGYRHSGYPTTLTLSHEPGFNRYAGVVDFPHFDAYRVTAPHADKWGGYTKYGEKNVRWGAPLETIGDYMRTLNKITAPNPVAAWTQGISDGWSSRLRPGAGNPNDLEMRIQAYETVANGALSLYWFNISGKNIIKSRKSLAEIQRINREIKVAGEIIMNTVPYSWVNRFMDIDLNVLAGPDYAVLFAIDLKYKVSTENQFVSDGERSIEMKFRIPGYLKNCDSAIKITSDGVSDVSFRISDNEVIISDKILTTGMYIVYDSKSGNIFESVKKRYSDLLYFERSLDFDPVSDDKDFDLLKEDVNLIDRKD